MSEIEFISDPRSLIPKDAFTVHLMDIKSKESLLKIIGNKLAFPDYYGNNWDALNDCLNDLHWIDKKEIVLVHDDLPQLHEQDFRTYVQILSDAVEGWKLNSDHNLRVIFSETDKARIYFLLADHKIQE